MLNTYKKLLKMIRPDCKANSKTLPQRLIEMLTSDGQTNGHHSKGLKFFAVYPRCGFNILYSKMCV